MDAIASSIISPCNCSWVPRTPGDAARAHAGSDDESAKKAKGELTSDERREIEALAARDREVQAHEMAHLAAAGPYARSGPKFTYETGPDGKRYAVGGEVDIDTSPVPNDPHATLAKAQAIQAAANAPASPSGQDRAVAAAAGQMASEAQRQLASERTEKIKSATGTPGSRTHAQPKGSYIDVYA